MLNEYVKDSVKYFHRCTPLISEKMVDSDVMDAVLFYAVAVEKILKGILWNVNPIYILEDQHFCNSAPVLYKGKFLPREDLREEISKNPNNHVLTYKKSLLRAKEFSATTNLHATRLFALSNYRDMVLHRLTVELDTKEVIKFLLETYPLITEGYAKEFGLMVEDLVGDKIHQFDVFGKESQKVSVEKIIEKIGFYNKKWNRTKTDPGRKEEIAKIAKYVQQFNEGHIECPACGNAAEVDYEPDYDYSDGQSWVCGVFPVSFKCRFCGLELEDPSEIDYLRQQEKF